jgi:hypothetical protein
MISTLYSGFTALAQVIGIGLSIWLVDRMGRRKLVLLSLCAVRSERFQLVRSYFQEWKRCDALPTRSTIRLVTLPRILGTGNRHCLKQKKLGVVWKEG